MLPPPAPAAFLSRPDMPADRAKAAAATPGQTRSNANAPASRDASAHWWSYVLVGVTATCLAWAVKLAVGAVTRALDNIVWWARVVQRLAPYVVASLVWVIGAATRVATAVGHVGWQLGDRLLGTGSSPPAFASVLSSQRERVRTTGGSRSWTRPTTTA